jgi:hypothetical protein
MASALCGLFLIQYSSAASADFSGTWVLDLKSVQLNPIVVKAT